MCLQGALLQLESALMSVSAEPEEASSDEEEGAAAQGSGDEGSEEGGDQGEGGDASRPISRAQVRWALSLLDAWAAAAVPAPGCLCASLLLPLRLTPVLSLEASQMGCQSC